MLPNVPCQPRRGCISVLVKAIAAMTSIVVQHCGSHLAASYQRSGVHAFLAGQEMGQSVKNVQKLWFTLWCRCVLFIFLSGFGDLLRPQGLRSDGGILSLDPIGNQGKYLQCWTQCSLLHALS